MPGQVAEAVKDERLARLQRPARRTGARLQRRARSAAPCRCCSSSPGRHPGQLIGRSPYLQAVHADAPDRLIGQIVPVRIEGAARMSLAGALVTGALETA